MHRALQEDNFGSLGGGYGALGASPYKEVVEEELQVKEKCFCDCVGGQEQGA